MSRVLPALTRSGRISSGVRVRSLVMVAAASLLALTACGGDEDAFDSGSGDASASSSSASKALTVGGANFTEMNVMQQMYGLLLTKAGYTVDYKTAETREIYAKSLESGEIDIVPEYAATMTEYLNAAKNGPEAKAVATADPAATVTALTALAKEKGLTVLEPAKASDSNAFVVTKKYSQDDGVTTLSQLAAKKKDITLAAGEECDQPNRVFCAPGLEKTYGFTITVDPLGYGTDRTKQAVIAGKADLGLTGSTDGTLEGLGLVVLEDDKKLQNAENLVPVVNTESAGTPEVADTLNTLSAVLTTEDLADLNRQVDGERKKPEDVAKAYLESKGLL